MAGRFNPLGDPKEVRLSVKTRDLAERYLKGFYRSRLRPADFNINDLPLPEAYPSVLKRMAVAQLLADKSRLEIVPEELLAGSAPNIEANWHQIPALGEGSISHTTVDFGNAVRLGLSGLEAEIRQRALSATGDECLFATALLGVITAMRQWTGRYREAYLQMIADEKDTAISVQYNAIVDRLEHVPENPPRTFAEAVQSLWSFFEFQRLCGNWSGLGRIDEYLGPYLAADLKDGRTTLDEAREILAHFWIKGTEWCFGLREKCPDKPGSGDAQRYQNIVLGGIDVNGNPIENDVTYLVLDIVEELHISDYPVAVRINRNTSRKLLKRIAQVQLLGGGIVSVYNEELILKALTSFGFPQEEARAFTNDGCWEVLVPGKTRFGYIPFDILKIFQEALLEEPVPADFDELYNRFLNHFDQYVKKIGQGIEHEFYHLETDEHGEKRLVPNTGADCVLSLMEPSCRESLRSYQSFGTTYTVKAIHAGGLPDVANSLRAIQEFVFERKLLTLAELVQIIKNDWKDHEELRQLVHNDILYYGNDDERADAMLKRVVDDYARLAGSLHKVGDVLVPVGISTFGREIEFAPSRLATAFGTHAHEFLAPNLSPTPGTDFGTITSVVNSYCKMNFMATPNGCPLDLRISAAIRNLPNADDMLSSVMDVFMTSGGWYLQIDSIDAETLREAQRNPDRFPNLVVRISGWSARFASLDKNWQDMIINRTSLEI